MARKKFVAGNWKMNKDARETGALIGSIRELLPAARSNVGIAVCPPFTSLAGAAKALEGSHIALGAQDVSRNAEGAFTGEVSARMLASIGCRYVIVGHSERRQYFLESDALVNAKAGAALTAGLVPIVCVGETLAEREAGLTESRIAAQVTGSLAGFTPARLGETVIAYEPVWAIGTGKTATPAQADAIHRHIRTLLTVQFDQKTAQNVRILYGGSVNDANAAELFSMPDIDGGLIGGASLKPESFQKICLAAG